MDDTLLRTLNFRIVPEMCHDQGRELSINDSTEPLKCQSATKFKSTVPLKQHVSVGHKKTQITDSLK